MQMPELTVKRKIIVSFILLAFTIVLTTSLISMFLLAEQGRGNFLEPHYQRFDKYRGAIGDAATATATFVASDPDVVSAVQGQGNTAMPSLPGAGASDVLARARESLHESLGVDFLVLFDAQGRRILEAGEVPFTARDVGEGKYFADVRGGTAVRGAILASSGGVSQVSGVPVRAPGGRTIGSLTVGISLERFFDDFRLQSQKTPEKRHHLALVRGGRVLASTFPQGQRDALAAALDPDAWIRDTEGGEETDLVQLGDEPFDFYRAEVEGYDGAAAGTIGHIFHMKTHRFEEEEHREQRVILLASYGAILLLAVVFGWIFSSIITGPLNRFVRATESLARGEADLTQRIEVKSRDEMGRLAGNLNALFATLQKLAKGVQRTSFQVASSSAEISAASRQMYDGAKDQATKVQSSSAAVTELSSSIQHVAENAVEATKVAKQSGEAVGRAIERMQRIRTTVEQAAERILDLGESGKRIGNIVEVIRQISEQTSLLALNASIEAAHAGEQGRGFAVVADEVSSLARRVGQSARDIEDLIATIKDQTAEAVRTMQAGTREVEEGTTLVATTLGDLKKISEVVAYTAQAVQEQAVASDEIARNMDAVQRITQDVVSSSEEAVVQGEHLHQIATTLAESVKGFKVDRDGDGVADDAPELPRPPQKRLPARRA